MKQGFKPSIKPENIKNNHILNHTISNLQAPFQTESAITVHNLKKSRFLRSEKVSKNLIIACRIDLVKLTINRGQHLITLHKIGL